MKATSAQDIANLLQLIQQRLHARLWANAGSDVHELTIQQMRALRFIQAHPAVPMGDLVKELGITKASVNALISRLCRKDWLTRVQDTHDRRVFRLSLSAQATKQFEVTMRLKHKLAERMIASLSSKDQRQLQSILQNLSAHLDASSS